jgi:hypothetical protein
VAVPVVVAVAEARKRSGTTTGLCYSRLSSAIDKRGRRASPPLSRLSDTPGNDEREHRHPQRGNEEETMQTLDQRSKPTFREMEISKKKCRILLK